MKESEILNMNFSMQDIVSHLIPRLIREFIARDEAAKQLAGTELSVSVAMLGMEFSYTVRNGTEVEMYEGSVENPVIAVSLTDDNVFQINIRERELLTVLIPGAVQRFFLASGRLEEMKGTVFTLVVEISGNRYSYRVSDGVDFDVSEEDLEHPLVRACIERDDLMKMISIENVDFLLGSTAFLSRKKYDACKSLKGKLLAEISDVNGSTCALSIIFNGEEEPRALFKLSIADLRSLVSGKSNPVNLFMSGAMKIEGDIAFAMSIQPLFT